MTHELPKLPYKFNELEPHLSQETLHYHYNGHHKAYVEKLNKLLQGTHYETMSLDTLVCEAQGEIYDNAAQDWNHSFYWECMSPLPPEHLPTVSFHKVLLKDFGSFENLKSSFQNMASQLFGSGWTWLVYDPPEKLRIVSTSNADNPLREGLIPLLVCDVWEHAYYIDYRNARKKYLEAFFEITNWRFVENAYNKAKDNYFIANNPLKDQNDYLISYI